MVRKRETVKPGTVVNDEQTPKQSDDTDRMEFRFPGGSFAISGKNASRVFWAVGITGIIIALGWAVANILGAWNGVSNVHRNESSDSVLSGFRSRECWVYSSDLPRWRDRCPQAAGSPLQNAECDDNHPVRVGGFDRV